MTSIDTLVATVREARRFIAGAFLSVTERKSELAKFDAALRELETLARDLLAEKDKWHEDAEMRNLRAEAAEARVSELEAALNDACDVAVWMSGSADFSPEGIAHEGWLKMRPKLYAAMRVSSAALAADRTEEGEA